MVIVGDSEGEVTVYMMKNLPTIPQDQVHLIVVVGFGLFESFFYYAESGIPGCYKSHVKERK